MLRVFYPFRSELAVQDGLVFKSRCLVVPQSQQPEVISQLHRSHLGLASVLRLARQTVFWVGMSSTLREVVLRCPVCLAHRPEQPSEPLSPHAVPERPWQKVGADLFEFRGATYLVLIDYFSNFVEVDSLSSLSTSQVVRCLSSQFARYGVPEVLISDNGPQFASEEFRTFARRLDIEHRTSSPAYPQSNGKAENAVRTVKTLWKKAWAAGENPQWALLAWRNAPSEATGVSPAQLMFGRPCRTFLPVTRSTLTPEIPSQVRVSMENAKRRQAGYYNRGTRSLAPLVSGQTIRMRLPGQSVWSRGVCVKPLAHRSYLVKVNGTFYRRNKRQIISSGEPCPPDPDAASQLPPPSPAVAGDRPLSLVPPPAAQPSPSQDVGHAGGPADGEPAPLFPVPEAPPPLPSVGHHVFLAAPVT